MPEGDEEPDPKRRRAACAAASRGVTDDGPSPGRSGSTSGVGVEVPEPSLSNEGTSSPRTVGSLEVDAV